MLNEIFKGIDNAAEVINENFQTGSIVASNLDEDNPTEGYYVRFGNGLQVCFGKLEAVDETTSQASGSIFRNSDTIIEYFPMPFIVPPSVSVNLSVMQIAWTGVSSSILSFGVRFYSSQNNQVIREPQYLAVGLWK